MNKANFTPGPWRVGDAGHTIFGPKSSGMYPNAPITIVRNLANKANAPLIAAAPEMYEALENAEIWLGKFIADCAHLNAVSPRHCELTFKQVLKALAKAEGKKC